MGSESKVLVQNRELSNLYEDIAEDIFNNLVFDASNVDYVNQLLFVSMMENAISYLADDVFDSFNKSETEVVLEIRLIASANKFDIVNTSIFLAFFILS